MADLLAVLIILGGLTSKVYAYRIFYSEVEQKARFARTVFFATWLEFGLIGYYALLTSSFGILVQFYFITFWVNALNFGIVRGIIKLFKKVKQNQREKTKEVVKNA